MLTCISFPANSVDTWKVLARKGKEHAFMTVFVFVQILLIDRWIFENKHIHIYYHRSFLHACPSPGSGGAQSSRFGAGTGSGSTGRSQDDHISIMRHTDREITVGAIAWRNTIYRTEIASTWSHSAPWSVCPRRACGSISPRYRSERGIIVFSGNSSLCWSLHRFLNILRFVTRPVWWDTVKFSWSNQCSADPMSY